MSRDAIEILHALELATGRSCSGLCWHADLVRTYGLDGQRVMRMFELVEEGCGVALLPVHILDWTLGERSVEALAALVKLRREPATVPAASVAAPSFMTSPGSMGRVR